VAGSDRALDRGTRREKVPACRQRARLELPPDDLQAGQAREFLELRERLLVAPECKQAAAEILDVRRMARRGLGRPFEAGERRRVALRLEVAIGAAEEILGRRGRLPLHIEVRFRRDLEMLERLRAIDGEGRLRRLGLRQALIRTVELRRGIDKIGDDEAFGRLAPGEAHARRLAPHFDAGDALRRLQVVVDREALVLGVVQRDVVAPERDGQRCRPRRFDLRAAEGRERKFELAVAINVDELFRPVGRRRDVQAVVRVDREAVESLVAAPGAEGTLPLPGRRVNLDELGLRVGHKYVLRRVGHHRDRAMDPARIALGALRVGDLVHEDPVAREDLHATVAGVRDVEIVREMQAADAVELSVARARAADGEAQRAVMAEYPDARAVGDGDVLGVERGALGAVHLGGEGQLDLPEGIQARNAPARAVEAQELPRCEGVGALAVDAERVGAPHAWQTLHLGRRRRHGNAEELDLAVADVGDRELGSGDRDRRDLGELAAAAARAAEAAAHLRAVPVDLADVAVARIGDEEPTGLVGGERSPPRVRGAANRLRREALEECARAIVDRNAAVACLLEHVHALERVDGELRGLHEHGRRIARRADRVQEDAGLREDGDAVITLVGDIEPPLRGEGEAFGVVELAVALAAGGEHALGAALRIERGEKIVARVRYGDAPAAERGDAAGFLRLERLVLAGELDRAGVLAFDAPERAALALDDEKRAVGGERHAAWLGKRVAICGLPAAQELDLGLLCGSRGAEETDCQRKPRIAGKQRASPCEDSSTRPHCPSRRHRARAERYFTFPCT
jgi:hypothetical protein